MFDTKQIIYRQKEHQAHAPQQRHWKLGKGPCGKTVVRLQADISKRTGNYMLIIQHCKGQKLPDRFYIPLDEIVGGIQFLNHKE